MRNLEQSVGMHRRLEGVGKSLPGEDVGTFDFRWRGNRHLSNRKAVCTVHRGEGWECLNIQLHDEKESGRTWPRPAIHSEIQKLLPLFFHPWERPVQFHSGVEDRARTGLEFWLSERVTQAVLHLPKFGPHFRLTKSTQP